MSVAMFGFAAASHARCLVMPGLCTGCYVLMACRGQHWGSKLVSVLPALLMGLHP